MPSKRAQRNPQRTVKYLSEQETKLFFNAVKKHPRDLLLFSWMYIYGLRVSECVSLKLTDILPDLKTPKEIFIMRLKGGVSRHFPIRSEDTMLLKRWLNIRARMKNARENSWLFPTSHSSLYHMSSGNVEKLIQKYGSLINLPREKCHPHVFRHSAAIHMLLNGSDIHDVQNHLGHTNISTTIQYYGHFGHEDWARKARERLETAFFI